MTLSKNQFFLLLFGMLTMTFAAYKLMWLLNSTRTTGVMWYTGHGNLGSALGITTYPVIRFKAGKDSLYFNSNVNFDIKPGEMISVRYQTDHPADACVNNFTCLWAETLIYYFFPILVLLIIFVMPERFDPLIPKKSKIILGEKPFIKIIKK